MHECKKNEGLRTLTRVLRLDLGRKSHGQRDFRERRLFGEREKDFLSRESEKSEF